MSVSGTMQIACQSLGCGLRIPCGQFVWSIPAAHGYLLQLSVPSCFSSAPASQPPQSSCSRSTASIQLRVVPYRLLYLPATDMVDAAMKRSSSNKFLIEGFPRILPQLTTFEQKVRSVATLVFYGQVQPVFCLLLGQRLILQSLYLLAKLSRYQSCSIRIIKSGSHSHV